MIDFQPIADACFDAFGVAATYSPAVGEDAAVTIIIRQPDEVMDFELGRGIAHAIRLDVRKSEVALAPKRGDLFTTETKAYSVIGDARADSERLVWSCPAAEVTP